MTDSFETGPIQPSEDTIHKMSYSDCMQVVRDTTDLLQSCNDPEKALAQYEVGLAHLKECQRRIEAARGRMQVLGLDGADIPQ